MGGLHLRIVLVALPLAAAGCSGKHFGSVEGEFAGDGRVNSASVVSLFPTDSFEKIDLVAELDPKQKAGVLTAPVGCKDAASEGDACQEWNRQRLARAFRAFYEYNDLQSRRTRIQERLMSSSEQRCMAFKTYLRRLGTQANFMLGTASTVSGTLGAIVTGEAAARALSGLAGIFSGTRAEWNQAYLSNLTTEVIVSGIDTARADILRGIIKYRTQNSSLDEYPVEAAIRDALEYHSACGVVTGLRVAQKGVSQLDNPGLAMVEKVLKHQRAMQAVINAEEPKDAEKWTSTLGGDFYSRAGADAVPAWSFAQNSAQTVMVESLTQASAIAQRLDQAIAQRVALLTSAKESGYEGAVQQLNAANTATKGAQDALVNKIAAYGKAADDLDQAYSDANRSVLVEASAVNNAKLQAAEAKIRAFVQERRVGQVELEAALTAFSDTLGAMTIADLGKQDPLKTALDKLAGLKI